MERLDNILKSVATSSTKVSVASAVILTNGDNKVGMIKQEPLSVEVTAQTVKARSRSMSGPSRKPSVATLRLPPGDYNGGHNGGHNGGQPEGEEERRKQRRERNKEAAARCRKRRLDLTCTLQVSINILEMSG